MDQQQNKSNKKDEKQKRESQCCISGGFWHLSGALGRSLPRSGILKKMYYFRIPPRKKPPYRVPES
jgi:hypothetical protein